MSYGFKRPVEGSEQADGPQKLDLGGFKRDPVEVRPDKEAAALARGNAMGFVDRSAGEGRGVRRRKEAVPSKSLYIKGPEEVLDWFIELTNERGYRSYWQALEEFRELLADSER